ncbi:MAG: Asp23/Gls24 family envelope stress response protein [Peptostreptococcaceae bacterium]|nr:Asp23/Gls24 family envelope stress response protein [Peptostreptococcaceae bacterium]
MDSQNEDINGGELTIEDEVIIQYTADEITKTDGVSRLVGGITESFSKNILGRESTNQGIKVVRDDNVVSIDVHIVVKYGVNIPQVAFEIQSKVKEVVEASTGLKIQAVNISVEGVEKR